MKQYSNLLLLILIVGLVLYSYEKKNNSKPENNKDKIARFDITSMKKLIQEKTNAFTEAHITGKKDSSVMVNYFTKDRKIFPPNSPPVIGQLTISELTSQYMKFRITEFSEENTAFMVMKIT